MQITIGACVIELVQGDITKIPVDAIVNAANSSLAGGGGVDGAIHRAGGPSLKEELQQYDHCPTGSAVVTKGGRLPAKYVFHAVGPVFRGGAHGEATLLASCYKTCLQLAGQYRCRSISFPAISTGVYGYPVEDAGAVALGAIAEAQGSAPSVRLIKLVQFSADSHRVYQQLLSKFDGGQASAQTS